MIQFANRTLATRCLSPPPCPTPDRPTPWLVSLAGVPAKGVAVASGGWLLGGLPAAAAAAAGASTTAATAAAAARLTAAAAAASYSTVQ